jgi:carboxypeptidase C (cathepsin A)
MVSETQDVKKDAEEKANEHELEIPEPIVRRHELAVGRKTLKYTTTTGLMPIRDDKGNLKARLFFTAYTLDDPSGSRCLRTAQCRDLRSSSSTMSTRG